MTARFASPMPPATWLRMDLDPTNYFRFPRRKGRALELSEIHVLQAQRISRRHLPGRPAGPPECRGPLRHPAADQELGGISRAAAHRGAQFVPLSSRAADRNPVLHRAHGAIAERSRNSLYARARLCRPNALEGVGAAEAPRGTLFHHYKIDEQGLIRWANLIIATGHNNLAMNRSILQVAKHFVHGETTDSRNAEPRRSGDPRLRSLPELLHSCGGPDGAAN